MMMTSDSDIISCSGSFVSIEVDEDESVSDSESVEESAGGDYAADVEVAWRLQQETVQLIKIFPAEVWIAISERIRAPNDLANFSNASPFFRQLVFENRAAFLFPQVLMIMGSAMKDSMIRDFSYMRGVSSPLLRSQVCVRCGRIWARKWFSELLSLRLVCRNWSTGVDQFCEKESWKSRPHRDFDWTRNDFRADNEIQQFLLHFSGTHGTGTGVQRSPFLCGHVKLLHRHHPQDGNFHSLLSLYGTHISFFGINYVTLSSYVERIAEYHLSYSEIWQLLEMMPRLKCLEYGECIDNWMQKKGELMLTSEIQSFPVPNFPSLETLRVSYLRAQILEELLRVNSSHLRVLSVRRGRDLSYTFIYTTPLSRLTEFSMNYREGDESELELLGSVNWPLEMVDLDFRCSGWKWSKLFCVLGGNKAWADTLQDVRLVCCSPWPYANSEYGNWTEEDTRVLRDFSSFRLELPSLRRFQVEVGVACPLDFLLPTKDTLKTLNVRVGGSRGQKIELLRRAAAEQKIQWLGYERKMYRSNIWKVLPRLKEVSHWQKGYLFEYSRREWEHQLATMNSDEDSFLHKIWSWFKYSALFLLGFCFAVVIIGAPTWMFEKFSKNWFVIA